MLELLKDAINAHDAARMAGLFAEDYESAQPVHPSRAFGGRAQVLANWSSVFEGVPDFTSELVASSMDGETEWGEWDWRGRHVDGSPFAMRGVTILVVLDTDDAQGVSRKMPRQRANRARNRSRSTTTRVTSPCATTNWSGSCSAATWKRTSRPSTYATVAVTRTTAPTPLAPTCSSWTRVPTLVRSSGRSRSTAAHVAASHQASIRGVPSTSRLPDPSATAVSSP